MDIVAYRLLLGVLLCFGWYGVGDAAGSLTKASVYHDTPSEIHPGEFDWAVKLGVADRNRSLAYGSYDKDVDANGGWRVLNLRVGYASERTYPQRDLMYAAGYLEGYLTQNEIYEMYINQFNALLSNYSKEDLQLVKDFYSEQREWAKDMVLKEGTTSRLWNYTALILAQFEGLVAGYKQAVYDSGEVQMIGEHLSKMKLQGQNFLEYFAFDFLAGTGDYLDIRNILFPSKGASELTYQDYLHKLYEGHCSVLIKLLPGYENIFASHSSWFTYSSMVRIYKHYAIQLPKGKFAPPSTEVMSFSSYPGFLSSLDDFYLMDSGLMMLQTTNSIFNQSVYDMATYSALLAWHRVRVANWLATSGQEWAEIVGQYNSGTYNNQYMVIDLNKIELQKEVHDGALWVVEQIPGFVQSGDQTAILRDGYWASYNVPFYEDIYNMSGYREAVEKMGTVTSYQLCPRAEIFRRDQGRVVDMDSMQTIMRYNNYKEEIYAKNNSMNTICSRGDLLDPPMAGGCTDTKVADYFMAKRLQSDAVNGPTAQGLAPFSWAGSGLPQYNLGQPDTFDYSFARMAPVDPQ